MSTEKKTLGTRIKKARTMAGLTQEQLAEKCEVATMTVSQWEQGRRVPSLPKLDLISEMCDVPLEFFSTQHRERLEARRSARKAEVADVA